MGNSSSPYSTLILIALMVVAFYVLIIRPNKKRQQAQQQTMSSLTPGTRVLLSSGLFGTLVEIGDRQAVLELSPGVHLTVLKQAIARTVQPGDEDDPAGLVTDDELEEDDDLGDLGDLKDETRPAGGLGTDTRGSHATNPAVPDQDPRTGTNTAPTKD